MNTELKIKKWDGENAAELIKNSQNVVKDFKRGIKQVVIVSAIKNPEYSTTDNLIELGNLLTVKVIDFDKIKEKIEEIRNFHLEIVKKKGVNNIEKINEYINKKFYELLMKITYNISSHDGIIPSIHNDFLVKGIDKEISVLGFGEIISADIQSMIINNLDIEGLKSESVVLNNITNDIEVQTSEKEIFKVLSKKISKQIYDILEKGIVPIISGYISGFKNGIENTIGRGYSDTIASMTAVGLSSNK